MGRERRKPGAALRELDLQEAVREIAAASTSDPGAFFFLVGAGISAPEVPLAKWISEDCRRRVAAAATVALPEPAPGMDAYSYWFERAFPQPAHRQRYLQELLQDSRISAAALRLAHVLASGRVSRLVMTPNFDESIERALKLFSVPSLVCDHPATAERVDPARTEVQVVHIHGTYWFYDCCNLSGEIADRATSSDQTLTMQSLIDRTLATSSPIVIGYAGWSTDVFMTALRRRLSSRLPFNLYWFCHTDDDRAALPGWLVAHQDVVIVSPSTALAADRQEDEDYAGELAPLPAARIMDTLIREMNLDPPLAITRPISHLVQQLEAQLPGVNDDAGASDIYQIESLLAALRGLEGRYSTGDSALADAEDALKRADYDRAIAIAMSRTSGGEDGEKFASILASAVTRSRGTGSHSIELFASALEALRPVASSPRVAVQYRSVLSHYAKLLVSEGRYREAISVADQAIELARGSRSGSAARVLLRVYNTKATAFAQLDDWESALATCDEALALGASLNQLVDLEVLRINRGTALLRLDRPGEALDEYEAAAANVTEGSGAYWKLQTRRLEALVADGRADSAERLALEILATAQDGTAQRTEVAAAAVEAAEVWLTGRGVLLARSPARGGADRADEASVPLDERKQADG